MSNGKKLNDETVDWINAGDVAARIFGKNKLNKSTEQNPERVQKSVDKKVDMKRNAKIIKSCSGDHISQNPVRERE